MYLLRELSKGHPAVVAKYLPNMADIGLMDHFKQAVYLKENLFKSIATIMNRMGKKKFRGFVELFIEPLFRNTRNENKNCAAAAEDCLLEMRKVYGENIFKAIVESVD